MASSGLRVLAMAVRKLNADKASEIVKSSKQANAETDLTFVGFVGLIDPPK
jgi:Ca2+-transporting ATPase